VVDPSVEQRHQWQGLRPKLSAQRIQALRPIQGVAVAERVQLRLARGGNGLRRREDAVGCRENLGERKHGRGPRLWCAHRMAGDEQERHHQEALLKQWHHCHGGGDSGSASSGSASSAGNVYSV